LRIKGRQSVLNQGSETLLARHFLSPRAAYVLMASVIGLALFASGTPSPLYGTYRAIWSLSPLELTLVYATYAFGVLTTLLLAGPVAWLFAARAVQGLATGLALSAASAGLLDLHPRRDAGAVGPHNGAASAGGMGVGVLISAAIVELFPAPRVLPYVAAFVLFAIAFAGTLAMRSAPWAAAAGGSVALAAGLLGIVLATATGSGPVYVIATLIAGAGFGVTFLGALAWRTRPRTAVRGPAAESGCPRALALNRG
jgi:MFS family permease